MKMLKTLFYFAVGIIVVSAFIFSVMGVINIAKEKMQQMFGNVSNSSLEYATGTPTYLSTYLTSGFTSTTTVSNSGGDSLQINIWGKPKTATSTMGVYLQGSQDGTNFFTLATGTQDGIYKSYSYPSYVFYPGAANVTSTISFALPQAIVENTKFIRVSFNETDLSTDPDDGVNTYIEIWKKTQY